MLGRICFLIFMERKFTSQRALSMIRDLSVIKHKGGASGRSRRLPMKEISGSGLRGKYGDEQDR